MKNMLFGVFIAVLLSGAAYAAVSSDVALVEDTDGKINDAVYIPLDTYHQRAACAFFKDHDDIYDVIFIFTSYSYLSCTPSGYAVKESIQGIGRDYAVNSSTKYCSNKSRLKHAVKMGDLSKLPMNPDDLNNASPNVPYSGIEVVAHEFGHYWLSLADFSQDGFRHCMMRSFVSSSESGDCDGYKISDFGVHWSFLFANHSPMFGSLIEDQGGGKFKIIGGHPKYSPLDQYLMGLRSPESVPGMFIVKTTDISQSGSYPLGVGESQIVDGERWDLTVQDVIAQMGVRNPTSDPCHWKAAFLIVYPKGAPPNADQIAKVEAYRTRWEEYYDWATDHRGSVDTTLDGRGTGTAGCPGEKTEIDAGVTDSGTDAAQADGALLDAGKTDAGKQDGGPVDGGVSDGGFKDGGTKSDSGIGTDGGQNEPSDAGEDDTSVSDPDSGSNNQSVSGCSCSNLGL